VRSIVIFKKDERVTMPPAWVDGKAENYHCMAFTSKIHKAGSHLRRVP
jgi:hypothetical protein